MVDDVRRIILRYMVDVDGETDTGSASDIVNGELIQTDFFFEYDPKSNDFYNTAYSSIFDAAQDYYRTFGTPITDSLLEQQVHGTDLQAKDKHTFLEAIRSVRKTPLKPSEYAYHRQALIEGYQKQRALSVLQKTIAMTKDNPVKAMAYASREFTELTHRTDVLLDPAHMSMDLAQFAKFKKKQMLETGRFSHPCGEYGFPSLDRTIGGLFPSEITVLAGSYNTGKSFLLQELALHNAFNGVPTVWASLENSDNQTILRLLAHRTRISLMKINNNDLTEDERAMLVAALEEMENWKDSTLLIVPAQKARNPLVLKNEILRWNPDTKVCCVDYINRMESYAYRGTEPHVRVQYVLQELKSHIGQEVGAAVVTPAQLNREGSKDPSKGLSTMQFNSINQDADNVFILYHDTERQWTAPPAGSYYSEPGEVFMRLDRARNAPKDLLFKLEVEFTRSLITECENHPVSNRKDIGAEKPEEMGDDSHRAWIPPTLE